MNIIITAVIDKRETSKLTNGTYHVRIRITHKRQQNYLKTKIYLSEEEWQEVQKEKPIPKYKSIKERVDFYVRKAKTIVDAMPIFTFTKLEGEFYENKIIAGKLINYFNNYIDALKKEERYGSATCYENSLKSLLKFRSKIDFEHITPEFLQQYENWMLKDRVNVNGETEKASSVTTIGIYLRSLRAIINMAISNKIFPEELYPFGDKKYVIPSGRNIKKALTFEDVGSIFRYECPPNSTMEKSRDIWVFSYLCNGMNIKDIALLKYKNIQEDSIQFIREKTKRSKKDNQTPIDSFLLPQSWDIIKKWGNERLPNNYIFPIIDDSMPPLKKYNTVKQFTKIVNKYTRKIALDLGIEKDVTTYTARHTFSDVLKNKGAGIEYISKALGHSNIKTTESYLDSFSKKSIRENTEKLL